MANWRKTRRYGKFTTTQNASGKSSVSQRVTSGSNVNINRRYVQGGTVTRTTYKSGDFIKVIQSSNMAKKSRSSSGRNTSRRSVKSQKNEVEMFIFVICISWGIFLIIPFLIGYGFYKLAKFMHSRFAKKTSKEKIMIKDIINNEYFQFTSFFLILLTLFPTAFIFILALSTLIFVPKLRHNLNLNNIL